MAKEFLDIVGLQTFKTNYDEEIKAYIKDQGLTVDDVQEMIDSVSVIQVSEDSTYEPLEEV